MTPPVTRLTLRLAPSRRKTVPADPHFLPCACGKHASPGRLARGFFLRFVGWVLHALMLRAICRTPPYP